MRYKRLIQLALMSDERIRNYVWKDKQGNPNIAPHKAPHGQYPAITHELIAGNDTQFADGDPYVYNSVYQVMVYSTIADYDKVIVAIDEVMRKLGFSVIFAYTDINPDTNVISAGKHYKTQSDHEMFQRIKDKVEKQYKESREK